MTAFVSLTQASKQPLLLGNRYRLLDLVGAGGMGSVYRAVDELTGETVALKRVAPSVTQPVTTPELRLALAHEFQALAGLHHPNIIAVRDYGFTLDHQSYFTMELLADSRSIVDAGQWLAISGKIDLLLQLLAALTYIHRRSIVHRDLKPGNVLVSGQTVKVLDFGLATIAGAELPSSGTLAYMAPEVIKGEPTSSVADLYAVGVLAYELLAGWHPFVHAGQAITQAILHEAPDFTFVEIEPPLQLVLQRLLAKRPEERYLDAAAVIVAFCEATGQPLPTETAATRESFLQAAPLIGRDAELAQLDAALQQALHGQGSAWLVGGESGIGKSRLLQELRTHSLVAGALVLRGQANSESGGAFALWRDAMRQLVLLAQPEDRDAAVLQTVVPDIAQLLQRTLPAAPFIDPKAAQTRLMVTLADLVRRGTARQPLLFILEDLQWMDDNSDELLQQLNRLAPQLSLLLVGSYRHDEYPQLSTRLSAMKLLRLHRLAPEQVARLSEAMLGAEGQRPHLVKFLQQETEGNTFFMVEVMRALAEEAGRLDQIGTMNLPLHVFAGGMQLMVQRRLQRVPLMDQPLLQLAAVGGRELDLTVLQQLAPTQNLDAWLTVCANAALLTVPDGGLRWQFTHDKLREGILIELSAVQRRTLHHQIAVTIEQVYASDLSAHYGNLAYHYGQTTEQAQARRYLKLAGETAQALFANTAALDYYERLFVLLDDDREKIGVLQALGAVLRLVGRWNEAAAHYQQALDLARQHSVRPVQAHCMRALGSLQASRGNHQSALTWLAQAHAEFTDLNDPAQISETLNEIGIVFYLQGEYDQAITHLEESLRRARPLNNRLLMANALHNLGNVAFDQGNYAQTKTQYEAALLLYREIDNKQKIAAALNNLGILASYQADYVTTKALYEESLALRRAIGDTFGVAVSLNNLGIVFKEAGDYAQALAFYEESMALQQAVGDKHGVALVRTNLAAIAAEQGNYTHARALLEQSLAERREMGDRWGIASALSSLGDVAVALQDYRVARAHYAESLALLRSIGDKQKVAYGLTGLAAVALRYEADPERAVCLAAAAQTIAVLHGLVMESNVKAMHEQIVAAAHTALAEQIFANAWSVGQALQIEDAISYALEDRDDKFSSLGTLGSRA